MAHLTDLVGSVPKIGPKKEALLHKWGIISLYDALHFYPFRYDDWSKLLPVGQMYEVENAVFVGEVVQLENTSTQRRHLKMTRAVLTGKQGEIVATWFGGQITRHLFPGTRVLVYGRVDTRFGVQINVQQWRVISNERDLERALTLHPVYSLTDGLSKVDVERVVDRALTALNELPEPLDSELRKRYGLLRYGEAVAMMHHPRTLEDTQVAYENLVIYEFLALTLWGEVKGREQHGGVAHTALPLLADDFVKNLPYELTGAQKRAIHDIVQDMMEPVQMHRLLQGDVGSGKTNVAFYAMLLAISNGKQAALMAPTEVLAKQHYKGAEQAFAPLGVHVGLLTGSMKKKEKDETMEKLANGDIDAIIGTHALLEDKVIFKDLSLVVIDEQHRFGVRQRDALEKKGHHPDLLVTTATPIPRSLALTVYGNLSLTVIDEMPANRKKIQTMWINSPRLAAMYGFIRDELSKGRQAFVVCPLVEESEVMDLQNATQLAEELAASHLLGYKIGLLHGRMKGDEKESIMRAFREKELDVLVSTTVIEVGVDVPNATVMVVMNAERFGLAQLHQLRGRVGRGAEKSYCVLVSDATSEESQARLKLMATSSDGFEIAEEDLRQRGPGELLGMRQHGQGLFRLARPGYHQRELDIATRLAHELCARELGKDALTLVSDIDKKIIP